MKIIFFAAPHSLTRHVDVVVVHIFSCFSAIAYEREKGLSLTVEKAKHKSKKVYHNCLHLKHAFVWCYMHILMMWCIKIDGENCRMHGGERQQRSCGGRMRINAVKDDKGATSWVLDEEEGRKGNEEKERIKGENERTTNFLYIEYSVH